MGTRIEWCTETWNPIIGCSKISEGCQNCYAEKMAYRLSRMKSMKDTYMKVVLPFGGWEGNTVLIDSALEKPLHWKKPKMIFVCSMGDLFHESVPFEWINQIFGIIQSTPKHTYQILTKRPERLLNYINHHRNNAKKFDLEFLPIHNLWLGVTAENQKTADERIPILHQIPAKVRFVSCEPLLENIIINEYLNFYKNDFFKKINWVITGRETGHGARPMKIEWLQSLYQQCKDAGVPFFDKRNELGLNIQQYPHIN